MDSKYSIFSKTKPSLSDPSPFSQNLKRKFAYGSHSSAQPAKKPNLQNDTKSTNSSQKQNTSQNGASTNKNVVVDIQAQRRKLPVFAVRNQYVNLTTFFFIYEFIQLLLISFCFDFQKG